MKKLLKSMACFAVAALVGTSAFARAGWLGAGAIYIGEKVEEGVCNGWYYADSHSSTTWCNGGPFGGADLGNLTSLTLGGQVQLWDESSADWGWGSTAKMYYSIDGGTAQLITMDYYKFESNNNFFQVGGNPMVAVEVSLAGLNPGAHTLAVYFDDYDSVKTTPTYTATFTIPEIKVVTFDGNGEGVQGVPDTLYCEVGGVYKEGGIPSPTRTNYRFRGWYTDPRNGYGERIRGHYIVEDAEPMTLWAHWDQRRQTVTFHANGDGAVLLKDEARFDQGGTYSGSVFTMKGATWANHKFLGWYDQAEGGSPVQWGDTVTSEDTRELFAHWRQYRQVVTFHANGEGASVLKDEARFDCGGTYTGSPFTMNGATWDNHYFMGWYDEATGERVWWGSEVTGDFERDLYAHWRAAAAPAFTGFSFASKAAKGKRDASANYELIDSVDDLQDGTYVILTGPNKNRAMQASSGSYFGEVTVTDVNGVITTSDDSIVWKVVKDSSGKIALFHETEEGGQYAGYPGSGNAAKLQETAYYHNITLESSGLFKLTSDTVSTRFLQHNSASTRFAYYQTSSNMKNLYIYAKAAASEPTVTLALDPDVEKIAVGDALVISATADGFTDNTAVTWTWTGAGDPEDADFLLDTTEAGVKTVTATATLDSQTASASATITVCTPHAVNVTAGAHGVADADFDEAIVGTTVTVEWVADGGYTLDAITVNNGAVTVTDGKFEMPDAVADVSVTFRETDEFEKITSIDDLKPGDYVITGEGSDGSEYAMLASVDTSGTNPYIKRQETAVDVEGSSVFDPDASIVWTLAQVDNGWTIFNEDVGYVAFLGPNNKNAASAETPYTDKSTWTIALDSGLFAVHNVASNRYLKYNPSSPRFATYTSGQKNLAFYKKKVAAQIKVVTFDGNGEGVQGVPDTLYCEVGGVYKEGGIPSPTRTNYRFRGWYTDPRNGYGERIRGHYIVEDAEPMTLWAHWDQRRQTVTFHANGDGAVLLKDEARFDQGGTYSGSVFTMKGATWANHKFLGWYDQAEGGSPVQWGDTVTSEDTRELFAHWRQYRQVVTFHANGEGASVLKDEARFDCGGTYTGSPFTMNGATWDNHYFMGWYDEATGERVWWGDEVTADFERDLYAHWRAAAAPAFTGLSFASKAAKGARSADSATVACTLWINALAGDVCEISWASAMDGEWTLLKRWTSAVDGNTAVTVDVPADSPTGFFRLAVVGVE